MTHLQEYPKGAYVALVIRPQSVEEQWTQGDESYLQVHGYDMDGVATGALRFWRHEVGDIIEGKIFSFADSRLWTRRIGQMTLTSMYQKKTVPRPLRSRFELLSRTSLK